MSSPPPARPAAGSSGPADDATVLAPHYGVALTVAGLGVVGLALVPIWSGALLPTAALSLFGLFLVLQTALLRLEFSGDALLVHRQDTLLRRFPYGEWLAWRLFWPGLPVLFYFREQRSIHFLPVLFNPRALQQQLQQRLPHLSTPAASPAPAITPSAPAADDRQSDA
jgi:hypothetical protein